MVRRTVWDRRRSLSDDGRAVSDFAGGFKELTDGSARSTVKCVVALWGLMRGQRSTVLLALTLSSLAMLLKLMAPIAVWISVDYVFSHTRLEAAASSLPIKISSDRIHFLVYLSIIAILLWIVGSLLGFAAKLYSETAARVLAVTMRRRVFSHASNLRFEKIHELKVGGLVSLLRNDATAVSQIIWDAICCPWRALVQLLGCLIIVTIVDWRLLLIVLVVCFAAYVIHTRIIRRLQTLYFGVHALRQQVDSTASDIFGCLRIIRAFGREISEKRRFVRLDHQMIRSEFRVKFLSALIELFWELCIPLFIGVVLVCGVVQILNNRISPGQFSMSLIYCGMLLTPATMLIVSLTRVQPHMASLSRILDLLDEPQECVTRGPCLNLQIQTPPRAIAFRNVGLCYPGAKSSALDRVNFEVRSGQMVAIVGPSGAGKSTLCNLLFRFYNPTAGSIEFDGVDISQFHLGSYRKLLGSVDQDAILFDRTIEENIRYGKQSATSDDVVNAALSANAHEFIVACKHGYKTLVGERGMQLSAGQRQRIAIARVFLANPSIVILDEATSNLDSMSEILVQQSIARLINGKTTFVVTHRLKLIENADIIIVIKQGRVVEVGNHDRLVRMGGYYAKTWRHQNEGVLQNLNSERLLLASTGTPRLGGNDSMRPV